MLVFPLFFDRRGSVRWEKIKAQFHIVYKAGFVRHNPFLKSRFAGTFFYTSAMVCDYFSINACMKNLYLLCIDTRRNHEGSSF